MCASASSLQPPSPVSVRIRIFNFFIREHMHMQVGGEGRGGREGREGEREGEGEEEGRQGGRDRTRMN